MWQKVMDEGGGGIRVVDGAAEILIERALGRPSPNKKKRPSGLDDSRVSKSGSFLLSHLV